MAVSVRMNPLLEKELEQAARRQRVSKSQFIIDAVERALGHKDPLQLLNQVRQEFAPFHVIEGSAAVDQIARSPTKQAVRDILRAKHEAEQADYAAFLAARQKSQSGGVL